jgi:hypothetical protein
LNISFDLNYEFELPNTKIPMLTAVKLDKNEHFAFTLNLSSKVAKVVTSNLPKNGGKKFNQDREKTNL